MAMRSLASRDTLISREIPRNLLRMAVATALFACRAAGRGAGAAGRHRRHRHPGRHRECDRNQAPVDQHRRGDLRRGHRQAPRHQYRRVHLALAGADFAARRRPRFRHQPARDRPRVHDHAAERARTGQHRRQSQRRVRPVSLRAHELGGRLQDAGRAARGPGPRGHDRPAHDTAAAPTARRAIALNLRGEQNSNDNLGADSDDQGYRASFSFIDQFMDGRVGIAFGYAHLDSPLATRGFGTYEPWNPSGGGGTMRLPGRHCGRLLQQSRRGARPVHDRRHESPRGHGLDGTRRRHGDAASSSRATPITGSSTSTTRRWSRPTTRAASR